MTPQPILLGLRVMWVNASELNEEGVPNARTPLDISFENVALHLIHLLKNYKVCELTAGWL